MTIDPITLAVIDNGLRQVATEMDLAFERMAFSPVIAESRDRASGIYDASNGEVIVQGETGLPIFIGVMQFTTQSVLRKFGQLAEGDVVIVNDPFSGGTHVMDMRMVAPVYHDGALFAYVANTGHWVDMGGAVPGGFGASLTEAQQEGFRLPPMRLYDKGILNEDLVELIMSNIRMPEMQRGDLRAQVAALWVGKKRLTSLLDRYGADLVLRCIAELRQRSERLVLNRLSTLPAGTTSFETALDNDGVTPEPLHVRLDLTFSPDRMVFDFSRSSPPCRGPLNSVISTTTSAVYIALKHLFLEIPINAGFFQPITVIAPETTFLNARHPKPVSGCAAEVAQRVVDAVFGAMAKLSHPDACAAAFGTSANLSIAGEDPATGRLYVMYLFSGGGYGGHRHGDGLSNAASSIGIAKSTPIETLEQRFPIRFDYFRLREDSGGAGTSRGGLGIEYGVRLLRGDATAAALMDRGTSGPFGIAGGGEGARTYVKTIRGGTSGALPLVTKGDGLKLAAGDRIEVGTPGGGGFGAPRMRSAICVENDVAQGYVSRLSARTLYGAGPAAEKGRGSAAANVEEAGETLGSE